MTDVLVRRPDEGTHREDSADDGGRDASAAAISQGTQRSQGEARKDSPLQVSAGARCYPHLDFRLLISRTERQ